MADEYEGVTVLQPIADWLGLTIDYVNFLITLAVIGLLTVPLRSVRQWGRNIFNFYCFFPSLLLMLVLFGWGTRIVLVQVGVSYLLMRFTSERYSHISVLLFAMSILAGVHFERLFEDHSKKRLLDISYPLMITTQKVTSLAFGLHDSFMARLSKSADSSASSEAASSSQLNSEASASAGDAKPPSSEQLKEATGRIELQRYQVESMPDALAYLCYVLFFPGVLFGPFTSFSDFQDLYKELGDDRPSRRNAIYRRIALCVLYAVILLAGGELCPTEWNIDPKVFGPWSFPKRLAYMYVSMVVVRMTFYFAWTIGEALHMASGLGYNPTARRWNKLRNVDPLKIELATSPKTYIEAWNIQTALWLRHLAYWRLPRGLRTLSTFALSAVWHGFFPGYYGTFFVGIPLTHSARKVRRRIRPWFQSSNMKRHFYDVVTWFFTQLMLPSFAMSFRLLHLKDFIFFYTYNQFWIFHIGVFLVLLLPLPQLSTSSSS